MIDSHAIISNVSLLSKASDVSQQWLLEQIVIKQMISAHQAVSSRNT